MQPGILILGTEEWPALCALARDNNEPNGSKNREAAVTYGIIGTVFTEEISVIKYSMWPRSSVVHIYRNWINRGGRSCLLYSCSQSLNTHIHTNTNIYMHTHKDI